ncbi:MAG: T9SS type A sorting domain-containing protein [Bacteroidia bacterium]|nr:T9SS type A sorting domain-containing protein [Bacteroidia bacterium]
MTIYPNPASQYINIQYIGHDGEENTFELMDAIGKPVKKFRTTSFSGLNTFKVEVSALPKGFYTLKGTINEQIHSAKLILQ